MAVGPVLVQVTLPHISGLARDNVVNTFHFLDDPAAPSVSLPLAVQAFYFNTPTGGLHPPGYYIGSVISRVTLVTAKYYDLTLPSPPARVPYQTDHFAIPAAGEAAMLPAEVALCMSFHAAPIAGVDPRRLRGRIYFGPLIRSCANGFDPAHIDFPSTSFIADLVFAGGDLENYSDAHEPAGAGTWICYSSGRAITETEGGVTEIVRAAYTPFWHPVVAGYVDDEWDHIRKRGERATVRTVF